MKPTISIIILLFVFAQGLCAQSSFFESSESSSYFTNLQYSSGDFTDYFGGGFDLYTSTRTLGSFQTRFMIGGFAEFGGEGESGFEPGDGFRFEFEEKISILGLRAGIVIRDLTLFASYGTGYISTEGSFGDESYTESFDESETESDLGLGIRLNFGAQKKLFFGSEFSDDRELTFSVGYNIFNR